MDQSRQCEHLSHLIWRRLMFDQLLCGITLMSSLARDNEFRIGWCRHVELNRNRLNLECSRLKATWDTVLNVDRLSGALTVPLAWPMNSVSELTVTWLKRYILVVAKIMNRVVLPFHASTVVCHQTLLFTSLFDSYLLKDPRGNRWKNFLILPSLSHSLPWSTVTNLPTSSRQMRLSVNSAHVATHPTSRVRQT